MSLITSPDGHRVVPITINDKHLPVDDARLEPVVNGNTGKTVHYFQSASTSDCTLACNAAWSAFRTWKRAKVSERRSLLTRVMEISERRSAEIVDSIVEETCAAQPMALLNVSHALRSAQEIHAAISEIRGLMPANDDGGMTFSFKESIGPVLVIPPWNAPFGLGLRAIAGVIAAGCTVVLKMSELAPRSHQFIVDIFREAGCPAGVLNALTVRRQDAAEMTEALIASPHIRKIEFIGSANIGRIIASLAGKYLKPMLCELGGKGPYIVLEDADLDKAAKVAAQGALFHHGQICVSTERILVMRSIADAFMAKLVAEVNAAPTTDACQERFAKNAYDMIRDAEAKGAKVLAGEIKMEKANSVKPVLLQIDPATSPDKMRIIDEETFGPSAAVYVVDSDEQAIELANRTVYGLSAAVHTKDLARGLRIGRELEYGQVQLNSSTMGANPMAPFRGVKASGWGRGMGPWLLEEWYVERNITWAG